MENDLRGPTLGEVVSLVRGTTYKSALLGQPGPVLLGLASIERNGGFRADSLKTYGGDSPSKLLLSPGDLYVSLKDVTQSGDLLGAIARVPKNIKTGRLTQDTVKLDFGESKYPRNLLYWALRTPQYRAYCRAHATGTTNLGLGREDFLAYRLPAATKEALYLVAVLDALDEKIELSRKQNETLEAMARALFKAWFVNFEPVRAKMEGRWQRGQSLPGLPAHLYDLFPDRLVESELGEIPEGWEVTSLAEFSSLNPETWTRSARPKQIHYVDLSNTKWGRIESVANYDADNAPSRAQRVLRPLDTIVGTVRPGNGSYAMISDEGLTGSTGFAVLRPVQREFAEFIYLAATARENIERLSNLADGGAYPAVRPEIVSATQVPRAGKELINEFSRQVSPMLSAIADNERVSRTLAQLRDILLPKLISGELRIADAEKPMEKFSQ